VTGRLVSPALRGKVGQVADNLEKLKALYAVDVGGKGGNDRFLNTYAIRVPAAAFIPIGTERLERRPADGSVSNPNGEKLG